MQKILFIWHGNICRSPMAEFVMNHPTVYMGTHTPQGPENLEAKRVIDLNNPVPTASIPHVPDTNSGGSHDLKKRLQRY